MTQRPFGIVDYWRMFKARGIRLPVTYFLQCHLYDLIHSTDTHTQILKSWEKDTEWASERSDGTYYMSSWSGQLLKTYSFLLNHLCASFPSYQFIDLGCGKGKPSLLYRQFCQSRHIFQHYRPLGIDYSLSNIQIANENSSRLFPHDSQPPEFIFDQAGNLSRYLQSKKLIIYMSNPFGEATLSNLFDTLNLLLSENALDDVIIVYNNPIHADLFSHDLWMTLSSWAGWHRFLHTNIYAIRQTGPSY